MFNIALKIKWMVDHWKPACALIYTVICVFDFVLYPFYVEFTRMPMTDFIALTKDLDETYRKILYEHAYRAYVPYTLSGGGLFHVSFGAILTGAVFAGKPNVIVDRRNLESVVD